MDMHMFIIIITVLVNFTVQLSTKYQVLLLPTNNFDDDDVMMMP